MVVYSTQRMLQNKKSQNKRKILTMIVSILQTSLLRTRRLARVDSPIEFRNLDKLLLLMPGNLSLASSLSPYVATLSTSTIRLIVTAARLLIFLEPTYNFLSKPASKSSQFPILTLRSRSSSN